LVNRFPLLHHVRSVTMRTRTFGTLAGAALALAGSPGADAAVLKVDCGNGGHLQSKLNAAPGGSTILVKGTCHGTFAIAKKITLQGNPKATLDGDDVGSVLTVNTAAPVRLVGLRIVDGNAPEGGGVLAALGGPLTLVRTTVTGNRGQAVGGGIAATGKVTLRHSSVSGNTAEFSGLGGTVLGGGILALAVTMSDSRVSDNFAHSTGSTNPTYAYGGGIVVTVGAITATRSHIDRNRARADGVAPTAYGGGALQQLTGPAIRLTRSTANKNTAVASATGGAAHASAGAVYFGRVVATRTDFVGNRAAAFADTQSGGVTGGAIFAFDRIALTRVHIRNSRLNLEAALDAVAEGGALLLSDAGGKLTMIRSTVSGSQTTVLSNQMALGHGGAIRSTGALTVTHSTISGNSITTHSLGAGGSGADGGAIYTTAGLTLRNSTLSGNSVLAQADLDDASGAGGALAYSATLGVNTIVNSTITKNRAQATTDPGSSDISTAWGGGIYASKAQITVTNTTVARNTVTGIGAAVSLHGGGIFKGIGTIDLRSTILASNEGADGVDCYGEIASGGFNLIGSLQGCSLFSQTSDVTNKPAKLGTLGDHGGPTKTITLLKGSNALNAIPKSACKTKEDQRGVKRPQERRCEIGAWERKAS
jgi:hypothetical protein